MMNDVPPMFMVLVSSSWFMFEFMRVVEVEVEVDLLSRHFSPS
jgi:hypothetical protein